MLGEELVEVAADGGVQVAQLMPQPLLEVALSYNIRIIYNNIIILYIIIPILEVALRRHACEHAVREARGP